MKRKQRVWKAPLHLIEAMEARVLLSSTVPTPHPLYIIDYNAGQPTDVGSATPIGLTPAQVTGAYGISNITFNGTVGDGTGQTIGIVDAYDDPNALSDLQAFDAQFGLQDPPSFQKLNEEGLATPLPGTDPAAQFGSDTWEVEESLDIEWAHAMAPGANIILFEADDASSLYIAEDAARNNPAVSVISNSWGNSEFAGETADDSTFTTPAGHIPITFLAGAGDTGIYSGDGSLTVTPFYPGSSPNIVSVGGTRLTVTGNNTYGNEIGWGSGTGSDLNGGGGGGISTYESQPAYQNGVVTQSTTQRTYPDVAMNADPASGVPVYDSFDFNGPGSWVNGTIGGTSLATPTWAGIIAIADQGRVLNGAATLDGPSQTLPKLYALPATDYHDIITGNNGDACGPGYDLVTGLGTPRANLLVPALVGGVTKPFIGDFVFDDTNANGIQDPGETGVPGVVVDLISPGLDGIIGDGDDIVIQTTTSDANGNYGFSGMAAGTYYVQFHLPATFNFSPALQGGNPALDSNADPLTGDTALLNVTATSVDTSIDCGMFVRSLSITNVAQDEGDVGITPFVFTVTITPPNANSTIDVSYQTADGSATVADNDYQPTSGTLVFGPGVSTRIITVNVIGDTKIELDESFFVLLSNPPGFGAGNLVGVGTIINDDFPSAAVGTGVSVTRPNTGTANIAFAVTLSAPAPFDVFVPYQTVDDSAVSAIDFEPVSGTLDFTPGQTTLIVNVTVNGGTNPQFNKQFFFDVQASSTALLGNPSQETGTILSNVPPGINVQDSSVTESLTGTATMPFNVTLAPTFSVPVSIDYATSNGTAIAGVDYTAASGTLVFAPGQVVKTVYITIARQFVAAQDKTFTFALSNVQSTGTVIISRGTAVGTIHDIGTVAIPFDQNTRATYTDYLNNKVTVSLKGFGDGTIVFLGTQSNATDAYLILVDGASAASSLTIKTNNNQQTSFHDILITGSMDSINGKNANLLDQLNVSGSLNTLILNYMAAAKIIVGTGTGTLGLTFSRVLDSSITSGIPIRSLTAANYLNTDGVPDDVTAPEINTIKIKGNFQGTLVSASVADVQVGGSIQGASILATDSIGTITAAGISDSTIFAGILGGLTTLPTSASDFTNTSANIKSVKVSHGAFSNTLIAAWKIGALSLGAVQTADGGTQFGVSSNQLASISAFSSTPIDIKKPSLEQSLIDSDFILRSV